MATTPEPTLELVCAQLGDMGQLLAGLLREQRTGFAHLSESFVHCDKSLTAIKAGLVAVMSDVATIKADVAKIKADLAAVRADTAATKAKLLPNAAVRRTLFTDAQSRKSRSKRRQRS
ncbi:hypothetical protein BC828DRAFT_399057 [Blastocladiella britannica]|nr:hypothetical protein BC828DRAFT_399057 [Blastocladiella britannica]